MPRARRRSWSYLTKALPRLCPARASVDPMTPRSTHAWIALALVGLAVAAGASLAASRLASQDIGLASEPLTAGEDLAPGATTSESAQPDDAAAERRRLRRKRAAAERRRERARERRRERQRDR